MKGTIALLTLVTTVLVGCEQAVETEQSSQSAQSVKTTDVAQSGKNITAQATKGVPPQEHYSPHSGDKYPTEVLFGDTHLHTALSFDAGIGGSTLMPSDGYRFAKGEDVISSTGVPVRLSRPLDFVVVADHVENLGFSIDFMQGNEAALASPESKGWYELFQKGERAKAMIALVTQYVNGDWPESITYLPGHPGFDSAWETIIQDAEDANEPGKFSAIIGWEWGSMPDGNNIHRNVIYRDGGDLARKKPPILGMPLPPHSEDPRALWQWMEDYEKETGGQVLTIAHNGNLSNGTVFPMIEPYTGGKEIDRKYAEMRKRYEPLYEVTQTKGDGEAHPALSPDDEFADFETWDAGNLTLTEKKDPAMLEFEYARAALRNGLVVESQLGVNPFEFGMIGSTDAHGGITAVEEDSFMGKTAASEPTAKRWKKPFVQNKELGLAVMNWQSNSAGYAAVWAEENTRESIFDAMMRRETYATTGTRMTVRFFGGWNFDSADAYNPLMAKVGYAKGVPMGGELKVSDKGKAPSFLVSALMDPMGANLDRVQIIKGWLNKDGSTDEKVYDVVWSGHRKLNNKGELPAVGNTVNIKEASWSNTIGTAQLTSVWQDPDFDPTKKAFYYVRVIEIPTPRWTAYDAKYFDVKMSEEVPMILQERAYTSPIWYTP
jgi:hypothetical protein